jgi:murein peptide amidase A
MTRLRIVAAGVLVLVASATVPVAEPSAASATGSGSGFTPAGPQRVLDTRNGLGLRAGLARQIPLSVPAGAIGVSLNLTITRATGDGFATVHPCDQAVPTTSTINFHRGVDIANASPLTPTAGGVCVTSSIAADVVIDLTGWWNPSAGTALSAQTPDRLMDSRTVTTRPLRRTIPRSGTDPVGLTLIITRPSADGFATVHECGQPATTSNLNFRAGQTVANLVLSTSGTLCVTTSVAADVIVDQVASSAGGFGGPTPTTPRRILDTRDQAAWVGASGVVRLGVGSARSVLLNVTAVRTLGGGFVNVWPCAETEPTASALSWSDPDTVATAVLARADSSGNICLRPSTGTHLLADVLGSDVPLPATITPVVQGRTNEWLLGYSVQGRPIVARAYGTATGRPALGVGNIHGDEQEGLSIVAKLKQATVPTGVEMWLIDSVNPDGMALNIRQNANGVDLNRNWPTNWQPIARSNNYSGTKPLSEPETRAALAFIQIIKPTVGVWWHNVGDYVDDSRSSVAQPDLITEYAAKASIGIDDAPCLGYCGGTATQHINATVPNATHMVVELPDPLSAAGASRHANAFLAIAASA